MNMFRKMLLASVARVAIAPFANPGWKLDADGHIVMKDGSPVYINAAGEEGTIGVDTITRLNGEAKSHRERAEKAEKTLEAFKDLDPEAARKAIDTVKNIDTKKLIDAGEVDKVKAEIGAEWQAKVVEKDKAISERDQRIADMSIGGIFAGSEFIRDKVAMPRDFFEGAMKSHFKYEDGKVLAYGRDGNRIMSKAKIGDYADPEEALQILVDMHPQKDTILRAAQSGGSGNGGGGGNRGGGAIMKRADFNNLPDMDKAAAAQRSAKGEIQIVD